MGRAEPGSTKFLANKMKAKGLQRLRWYCQACERQMRDENGFKQHTMSEGHVRQMQLIGDDPRKFIHQYSQDFKRDFLLLLRTAHGEKSIQINRFYQEYIANKEHVHMNATQWSSLTEFAKHLGREGICRVTEEEGKGVFIAWIDNSPDALRRQDAIRKKERQDKGDEEREKKAIEEQVKRAHLEAKYVETIDQEKLSLQRDSSEKISLSFGAKALSGSAMPPRAIGDDINTTDIAMAAPKASSSAASFHPPGNSVPKAKNVFATGKKSARSVKSSAVPEKSNKINEAERIMKQELESKRKIDQPHQAYKKIRLNGT